MIVLNMTPFNLFLPALLKFGDVIILSFNLLDYIDWVPIGEFEILSQTILWYYYQFPKVRITIIIEGNVMITIQTLQVDFIFD